MDPTSPDRTIVTLPAACIKASFRPKSWKQASTQKAGHVGTARRPRASPSIATIANHFPGPSVEAAAMNPSAVATYDVPSGTCVGSNFSQSKQSWLPVHGFIQPEGNGLLQRMQLDPVNDIGLSRLPQPSRPPSPREPRPSGTVRLPSGPRLRTPGSCRAH